MEIAKYDLGIIGSGIIGVSTARELKLRHPHLSIALIDKEVRPAYHQSGHNSGVVHAGVYYKPGSLKADFCKQGADITREICREHDIPYQQCGKLLVATTELEYERMDALEKRCAENLIEVQRLSQDELTRKEPNIDGFGALFVPRTAITDYTGVTGALLKEFEDSGGTSHFRAEVINIEEQRDVVRITMSDMVIETPCLIVCAGLMADRLARMMHSELEFQIIPFRGEYYQLTSRHNHIVKHLIYPIPDPELPFLGVHLTRMVNGTVTVGPNAVLGWKREGYGRFNFSLRDTLEMIRFAGFRQLIRANFRSGLQEYFDSVYKPGYLKRVRKYCPQLRLSDLQMFPAGIRAQAVLSDGTLVHDFLFSETEHSLHVCNAPSPAATSAVPIARHLTEKASGKFEL
jgi:L-2-hydroxyglutarate oxidase